jgi:dienelactone hydrolase
MAVDREAPMCCKQYAALFLVLVCIAQPATAQLEAPGKPVSIPGFEIPGLSQSGEVRGTFGLPPNAKPKVPVVLILHGSGGVDGRGAFYATALQKAGIATLEIVMFLRDVTPREGTRATMPHAVAALRWLATQPEVDTKRIGLMGFSWGGVMSVQMSSELVREKVGKDSPWPIAFAPLYPTCTLIILGQKAANVKEHPLFGYWDSMSASPMLIHVGTRDDFEAGDRPCDPLVAEWSKQARDRTIVRYLDGATHGFDEPPRPGRTFYHARGQGGRGGNVRVYPDREVAGAVQRAVVDFFIEHLTP